MLSRSPLETLVQIPFGWNWWFNLVNGVLFLAPLPALRPALQNGGSGHNVPHALEEGWPSGRRRALGERVYACVPWVRIPPPPPYTDHIGQRACRQPGHFRNGNLVAGSAFGGCGRRRRCKTRRDDCGEDCIPWAFHVIPSCLSRCLPRKGDGMRAIASDSSMESS